jgi:Putative esterase
MRAEARAVESCHGMTKTTGAPGWGTRSHPRALLSVLLGACALFGGLLFAPQHALADATTASDDFNRADGILGPNWTDMADGGLAISSDAVTGTAAAGPSGDMWTAGAFGSDQFSQIQLTGTQLTGGQWIGVTVRAQDGGQDGYTGLYFWNYGNPELMLFARSDGNWSQLGGAVPTGPLPGGTVLEVDASGPAISLLENGSQVITATDTSITGGAPGIMAFGTAQAGDWAGGDLGSPGSGSGPTAAYTVGGTVTGLTGPVVLQDNGGDALTVPASGSFTFATALAQGAAYDVTIATQPSGQTCTITGGSGTMPAAAITTITVTCAGSEPSFQATYESTDSNGIETYDVTSSDNGPDPQEVRILQPTDPAPGVAHNFLFVLPVEAGLGTDFGDGMETMAGLNAQNQYNLTIIEPTFELDPWYANNPDDAAVQYETFMTDDLVPWIEANFSTTGHEQNWLIGFSKSGFGAQDLILKHPDVFTLAASWDFPADMSSYDEYCCDADANYGTNASFQANYELTQAFVDAHKAPFLNSNRIWIGSGVSFVPDVADYDALLTSEGIMHTTEVPEAMPHNWDGGWVPLALAGLYQDSLNLGS